MLRKIALFTAVAAFSVSSAYAGVDEAKKWIDEEFQPSTLSKEDQMKEIAELIVRVLKNSDDDKVKASVHERVKGLCGLFPLYRE